ncbi:MAG: rhodanese-like domain-containing protein [Rhodospirillales bacterium]|nr:rhodanese-like domain-containing protein [Rhodospirillales bacterium]
MPKIVPPAGYAGDITPREAWEMLQDDPNAVLVDVRTQAEWIYVGIPDISSLGRKPFLVPWLTLPAMQVNPDFRHQVEAEGVGPSATILFICRSGYRSRDAAVAMTSAGYDRCYNVSDGFEGPLDNDKHRGTSAGWKADGLPWVQN